MQQNIMQSLNMQEPSQWSVDWLKNTRDAEKLIDIKSMKNNMNPTRLLVIGSVCKKDEKKNRTFHKEKPKRNICNFCVQKFVDCMHLNIHEELPCFDIWKVTTEIKRIINYCRVLECSPKLNPIKWMKNEETLVLRNRKYVGGGLNNGFITIKSPTKAERGTYFCTVTNAVDSVSKNITLDTPIRHFYYKPAEHFQHFSYIYNLMRDCKSRIGKTQSSKDQGNLMPKDIVVRIGIAGIFHQDNLDLISKSSWREKLPEDQHIWDVSPLIYFQNDLSLNSVIKIAHQTSARHRIIIKSDTVCDETNETYDSIIIVSGNKQKILETIITCLEEPFHEILQKWLKDLTIQESLSESAYDIIVEIEAIRKHLVFDVHENADAVSVLKRSGSKSIVPDNVKKYLFELSDVNSFGIWRNSSLKIFVKKNTDEKKMKEELMKINKSFLEKFQLEIEERKLVQKQTLLQGDQIKDQKYGRTATLGGFVREIKNKRKIYALTCSHMFTQKGQTAYAGDFEAIGSCVYTTREKACDFAAIEIKESFLDKCDLTFRRDDGKKVNANLYTESLDKHGVVFKIGATTNMTKGCIISSEYYDKVLNDLNLGSSNFLVKGFHGPFIEKGDSGSLIFSRPKCAQQTYIDVLGMVYATNLTVNDEVDHGKPHCKSFDKSFEDISVCYRIHTALELFEKKLGINVQFKDDLSLISTSSLQSYSSADSLDIL